MEPRCLLALAVWMAVFGIGGLFLYLTNRSNRRDIRLIRAATAGAMPRDGEVSAVVGKIHVLRDQIDAPFSKRRCVILAYSMYTEPMGWVPYSGSSYHDGRWERVSDVMCRGFQMAPCAVRTTKGDDVMVVELPDLHGFTSETFHKEEAYVAARDFVSKTFHISTSVKRTRVINSRNGIIERHHQYVTPVDPTGQTLEETCVLNDQPVCVIGTFSQRENGFISDTTVYCCTPETLISDISSNILGDVYGWSRWLIGVALVGLVLCFSR
jgi:hypothetical protein